MQSTRSSGEWALSAQCWSVLGALAAHPDPPGPVETFRLAPGLTCGRALGAATFAAFRAHALDSCMRDAGGCCLREQAVGLLAGPTPRALSRAAGKWRRLEGGGRRGGGKRREAVEMGEGILGWANHGVVAVANNNLMRGTRDR